MKRTYTVTLRLKENIPDDLLRAQFRDYINSSGLIVPAKTFVGGSHLYAWTSEGNCVDFQWGSVGIQPKGYMEELEAIQLALVVAKNLESATLAFKPKLVFNPNFIYLFVGDDIEGNYMYFRDFIPNAQNLQRILYGGGNIAYCESSGHFVICIGIEEIFREYNITGVIEGQGTTQPANSLDELLARIEQAK